jgi:hypothetical protein
MKPAPLSVSPIFFVCFSRMTSIPDLVTGDVTAMSALGLELANCLPG